MRNSSVRGRLLATTIFAGAILCSPVSAQTQQSAPANSGDSSNQNSAAIVVTGSRIASPTLTSGAPLQIIDSNAIQSTGASVLQDVLQMNPVVSAPAISRTNSNFSTSSVGVATVDLRNLGTSRTLVLVDGLRFVSGVPNQQTVDLNTIPTAFIDRVEIVSGGESAIYGSDAVAGVVNIIYKKHFSGIEVNVHGGSSQYGDDAARHANVLIGGKYADDRGNIMVYAGYSHDGAVMSADRARSSIDQTSLGSLNNNINDVFKLQRPSFSASAPQGTFQFGNGTSATLDPNGNVIPVNTNGTGGNPATGFNRDAFRYIAVPLDRYLIASRATYDVTPGIKAFVDTTFAHSRTVSQLEPFAISTSGSNGIFNGTGGFYPIEQVLPNGQVFVNPLVPAGLVSRAHDVNGDGLKDLSFTSRLTDIGDRSTSADRNTYRIVTGLRGELGSKWHWEAYASYGRTDDDQVATGQVNLANFRAALVVIPATPGTPGSLTLPDGTAIECADPNARANGCVPANVYGANKLSAAAAKYLAAPSTSNGFTQEIDSGANITGSLWDFWGAGPIGVATGVEYRKESSDRLYDALTQSGGNGGNALADTSGSFDVGEAYVETHIPLLTDMPFVKHLEFRAAGRVSDYSTVGTVFSWNYGLIYQPIPDVTFRVSKALATRAPNIGELFSGMSQTFPTGLIDPCAGVKANTPGTLAANCRAAPGVNANIAANGAFTVTQADSQSVSGFNSGNPNLHQEEGHTLTAGMVVNPRSIDALRNLSFTVDYTRTHITDAILATPRQFILNQCYQSGNPLYCQFITRNAVAQGNTSAGSLEFVNSIDENSGGFLMNTIDITTAYKQGLGQYGDLNMSIAYTHLLKGWEIPLPGAPKQLLAGTVGYARDKFETSLNWQIGKLTFEYTGQYIGESFLSESFVLSLVNNNGTPVTNPHDPRVAIAPRYYQNLQIKYDINKKFQLYFGIDDLFNLAPPPIYTGLPTDSTGTETNAGVYDAIGRRFYGGARVRF